MSDITSRVLRICTDSKRAGGNLLEVDFDTKNQILAEVAKLLKRNVQKIIKENKRDIKHAKAKGLDDAKIDRLMLDEKRINGIVSSIEDIIKLPDPLGKVLFETKRKNGLHIRRVTMPIGVLFAIYESRPNVSSDISALAIKSGNTAILRCGSESVASSKIITDIYREALKKFGVDKNVIMFLQNDDREKDHVKEFLQMDSHIDVVIPRGGKGLIQAVLKDSRIPVFRHLDGNCHTYIHEKADLKKALKIILNAKLRRVGICGATESLVIDKKIAKKFLPTIVDELAKNDCEIRGDEVAVELDKRIVPAQEKDFFTEYLDKIISVKVVKNIDEAIKHIRTHSSSHTESIVTEDAKATEQFFKFIDSAIVMHNASTQFADGGEFGLGAEVGIATGKLHARGPVGLEQLTTFKYIVDADCAIRS